MAEISNPNQQGGGDNKSLIAMMVVMVAVFFGLQAYRADMYTSGEKITQASTRWCERF